jgi:GYF domain 2
MPDEWYYGKDGRQLGPVSASSLREMAANGQLKPADLVWTHGMSQWAPAGSTRGLFPQPAAAAQAERQPEPAPAEPRRRFSREREDSDSFHRIRRQEEGWSTGAKLALAGGLMALFLIIIVAGFIGVMVIADAAAQRPRQQGQRFVFQPPPQQMVPPAHPPNFKNVNPNMPAFIPLPPAPEGGFPKAEVGKDYAVSLTRAKLTDVHTVELQPDTIVRIKVLTTAWGGGPAPDVDLHVYGPDGLVVIEDIGAEKDCEVRFTALDAGTYQMMTVLFSGNQADCTVTVEILKGNKGP